MKRKIYRIFIYLIISAPLCWPTTGLNAQDRNIQVNEVYPTDMFKENGGRFINVKNLTAAGIYHTNAMGDGLTNDSDAIIAAMDWIMERLNRFYKDKKEVHWHEC